MSSLKRFVKAITSSKKAMVSVAAAIFAFIAPTAHRYGVNITPDDVEKGLLVASVYVVGQGIADTGGKERVREEHRLAKATATVVKKD